jgi:peptide/nickel transport system substrate-binding protein
LNLRQAPWDNKLVRQAANYAIDREGLCKSLLNGTCVPEIGVVSSDHPWFGNPKIRYEYNPAKAKELLKRIQSQGLIQVPRGPPHTLSTQAIATFWASLDTTWLR